MSRFSPWQRLVALFLVGALLLLLYFWFDPTHSHWAPKCPFRLLTGWDCPACGSQRALHALAHGEFARALYFNLFLLISLPYFLLVAVTSFLAGERVEALRRIVQHPRVVLFFVGLTLVWWVLRNLPVWPSLLAALGLSD